MAVARDGCRRRTRRGVPRHTVGRAAAPRRARGPRLGATRSRRPASRPPSAPPPAVGSCDPPRGGRVRHRATALTATTALLLAACGSQDPDPAPPAEAPDAADPTEPAEPPTDDPPPAEDEDDEGEADPADVEVAVTDVATGLAAPWDVAFLGERVFVTERDTGRLVELADDGTTTEVRQFDVDPAGEGGLLGLAAAPDEHALYVYYTGADDNRVVRIVPDDPGGEDLIVTGIPKAATHNGGRLAFGPDGMLYVATGDAQDTSLPPDETSLAGKILRVDPDGEVPDDNPFGNPVWSLGHRNVQGLAFDADGTLYAAEFGPEVDDEVNVIEPGGDYGWPEVTGEVGRDDYVDPLLVRQPDEASWSGGTVLLDGAIPQWEGDLFVASLRGERLWRLTVEDGEVVDDEELLVGDHGRLRDVLQAPDGSLWVLTNNTDGRGDPDVDDDRILRLGPA
ncbi:PQQ-dependent sugar dehydrogenase [Nitriliruptoraceae bacterium ZYF776]|nr:PQQ-dependent sugar dehydrogenase [Profundirhabdus halotolerans]